MLQLSLVQCQFDNDDEGSSWIVLKYFLANPNRQNSRKINKTNENNNKIKDMMEPPWAPFTKMD